MYPPAPQHKLSLASVILGAGRSSRMGQPKLLLPWGDTTILGHLVNLWRNLGAEQLGVVCSEADEAIQAELEHLGVSQNEIIFNPVPERGMFSSIQCAAAWRGWRQGLTHWAIVLGDQPHLKPETLLALLRFSASQTERICQPTSEGHGRHPVVVPKTTFARLAGSHAAHFREFLQGCDIARCPVDDPGLALDIDWPDDYRTLSNPARET